MKKIIVIGCPGSEKSTCLQVLFSFSFSVPCSNPIGRSKRVFKNGKKVLKSYRNNGIMSIKAFFSRLHANGMLFAEKKKPRSTGVSATE